MDLEARDAERRWRVSHDPWDLERALAAFRRAGMQAPIDMVARRPHWESLLQLIQDWHEPPTLHDAYLDEEIEAARDRLGALPAVLEEWYRLLAARELSACDFRVSSIRPRELAIQDGILAFSCSNTGATWGIRAEHLDREDPPVLVTVHRTVAPAGKPVPPDPWIFQHEALSEFLLPMLAFQTSWCRELRMTESADAVRAIQEEFPPLPIPAWHWPEFPTTFSLSRDAIFVFYRDEWLHACARTPEAWRRIDRIVSAYASWVHVDTPDGPNS